MDSIQSEVYAKLLATGYPVSYHFPQDDRVLPSITYFESTNREWSQADGNEYLTEVEYTVDVWGLTPESTATVGSSVDTQLATLRLKRIFSHDLYETDTRIHHKSMRYRAIIHIDQQKIYQ